MDKKIVIKVTYEEKLRRATFSDKDQTNFAFVENKIRSLFGIAPSATLDIEYEDSDHDIVKLVDDDDLNDAVFFQGLNPVRIYVTALPNLKVKPVAGGDSAEQNKARTPCGTSEVDVISDELKTCLKETFKVICEDSHVENLDTFISSLLPGVKGSVESFVTLLKSKSGAQTASKNGHVTGGSETCCARKQTPKHSSPAGCELPPAMHVGVQCDVCGMLPITGARYKSVVKDDYDLCSKCYSVNGVEGEYNKIERPLFRPRRFHSSGGRRAGYCKERECAPCLPPFAAQQCPFFMAVDSNLSAEEEGTLDAQFVQDVTVFDGTELPPGTAFTKIWRLRNSGSAVWPQHTQLVLVGGDRLSEKELVPVPLSEEGLKPGEEVQVSVDMVAPQAAGRYVSHWRLMAPGGRKFGHRVWSLIAVVPQGDPSPQLAESLAEAEASLPPPPPLAAAAVHAAVQTEQLPETLLQPAKTLSSSASSPDTEDTGVGGFALVDRPEESEPVVKVPEAAAAATEAAVAVPVVEEDAVLVDEEAVDKPQDAVDVLVDQLQAMGFTDRAVNAELLKENGLDLQAVLDVLVEASEWDPMLEELNEMGFNDSSLNRKLMIKTKGSVKQVVKELVQMYRGEK